MILWMCKGSVALVARVAPKPLFGNEVCFINFTRARLYLVGGEPVARYSHRLRNGLPRTRRHLATSPVKKR